MPGFDNQRWNSPEESVAKKEEQDFLNNANNVHIDNIRSQSIQYNNQCDFVDPTVDDVLSDLRRIDENSIVAADNVRDKEGYDGNGKSVFHPLSIARLKNSFLPRSSSAESASTTNTSHNEISNINHQLYQQQSPQQCDSSTASDEILSVDNQNMQPEYFTSSTVTSNTSMSSTFPYEIEDYGIITPTELGLGITPTPINPYHNETNIGTQKEREELKDTKSVDELMAHELNKLSFQEREMIYEEIHGIDVRGC